jgi:sugar phosphate isomerase/epimerase
MIISPGLVSITFRQLSPCEIIKLVASADLKCIEWGGDVHVPHGEVATAVEVGEKTREAGLQVAAYGSYYSTLKSEKEGLTFSTVLKTAENLKTPFIRIWAGEKEPQEVDKTYWDLFIKESRRIASMAADKNIALVYEFHTKTLTSTYDSSISIMAESDHPNLFSYWQPQHGVDCARNCQGLKGLLPWIRGVHVFNWRLNPDNTMNRLTLSEGKAAWTRYFETLSKLNVDFNAMVEFVIDDKVENFQTDAKTLREWTDPFSFQ